MVWEDWEMRHKQDVRRLGAFSAAKVKVNMNRKPVSLATLPGTAAEQPALPTRCTELVDPANGTRCPNGAEPNGKCLGHGGGPIPKVDRGPTRRR
jgi:hypothetical protein